MLQQCQTSLQQDRAKHMSDLEQQIKKLTAEEEATVLPSNCGIFPQSLGMSKVEALRAKLRFSQKMQAMDKYYVKLSYSEQCLFSCAADIGLLSALTAAAVSLAEDGHGAWKKAGRMESAACCQRTAAQSSNRAWG